MTLGYIVRNLVYRVILDRRDFTWQTRMTLKGWLRIWAAPDITLLGWPGRRFWHAHLRYRFLYGDSDWQKYKIYAEKRHAQWVESGKPFTLKRNASRSLYVEGPRLKAGEDESASR